MVSCELENEARSGAEAMHGRFASICLLTCCVFCQYHASYAQDSPIAPLLHDDAWLMARIDVEKVQVQPLYAVLEQVVALPGLPSEQATEQFATSFRQAGGKVIYLVKSGESAGFLFAPLAPGANAAAMGEALMANPLPRILAIETTDRLAEGVFAGSRSMLLHLRKQQAKPRANLDRALAATSGSTLQVLLLPTDANRRFLEGFAWNLFRSAAAETAVNQIEWASIGIDGPPEPRLKIVFEAKDASVVDRLEAKLDEFLEPLITDPAVRKNLALVENLRRILTWRREGTTVSLDIDDREGNLTVVARGMVQPVLESRLIREAWKENINQLKQFGIAMQGYHDVNKRFPPPAILDADGKPLLSWRVALLPYFEDERAKALYTQFQLNEPWDSPHNKTLLARMPDVYRCPLAHVPDDQTIFLAPRGEGTVFSGPDGTPIRQIIDGTSKTVHLVEGDDEHAVPWTKPDDWPFDPDQPTAGLGGHFPGVFMTLFCDGSVHVFQRTIDPDTMRKLISFAGREVVEIPQ
jgi:Protein of unknown function (DUF1559)